VVAHCDARAFGSPDPASLGFALKIDAGRIIVGAARSGPVGKLVRCAYVH